MAGILNAGQEGRSQNSGKRLVKTSLLTGLVVLCAPVSAIAQNEMYKVITDHQPGVGISSTVYLGDAMLSQRVGQYQECIIPQFDAVAKDFTGINSHIVKAGQPLCKTSANAKNYTPSYPNVSNSMGGWARPYDVKLKIKGRFVDLCASSMCVEGRNISDIKTGPYFLSVPNALQQTIEYAGKSGDILKFIYSESINDFARQPFTREFQIDLSEGRTVGYKGAIIEVGNADNTSITYRVVRNFQQ